MLAAGSLVCAWVVVTTAEDTEATEGVVVDSRVVFEGLGVDLLAVLSTGWFVDTGIAGLCAWRPVCGVGLAVEVMAVDTAGPRVLVTLLVFVAVTERVAPVAAVAVLGDMLAFVLGTCA